MTGVEVVLEGVSKSFEGGRIGALDDVSLRIEPGEFAALTGPSGSGKSTLLNLIGALDEPDSGTLAVDGHMLDGGDATGYRATTVGFVFQFHNLISTLNAAENVQLPMFGRRRPHERAERARELLEEVGLGGRVRSYPSTLSGGERQRVAIARALANDPRLLLADEPTGALDSANGEQIVTLLQRLRDQRGMTILLVTNDASIADRADRTLGLRDGRITPASEPRSVPA